MPIVEGIRRATTPDANTGVAHFSVSDTGALIRWVAYGSYETRTDAVYVQSFPATGAKCQISSSPNTPRRFEMGPDGTIVGVVDSEQSSSEAPAAPRIEVVLNWLEELKAKVPEK